jgi:hypothetical protein
MTEPVKTAIDQVSTYYADFGTPGILNMTDGLGPALNPILKKEGWEQNLRSFYIDEARKVCDCLFAHMPGGLIDAIFAEMASRKASVFSVSHDTIGANNGK